MAALHLHDVAHIRFADAKLMSQRSIHMDLLSPSFGKRKRHQVRVHRTHSGDVFLGQPTVPMRKATRHTRLCGGVLVVVVVGAKEEVLRVHAPAHVTPMADKQPLRNGSDPQLVRDSVSELGPLHPAGSDATVAVGVSLSGEEPASGLGVFDFLPESFFDGCAAHGEQYSTPMSVRR